MKVCCFFGQHDAPVTIKPLLQETIHMMICEYGVTQFYVGNNGAFDIMVASVLRELHKTYPKINCCIVLAYMPSGRDMLSTGQEMDALLPDGIERVPRKFAISYRNKWMVANRDCVIAYVHRSFGGAAQFVELARRKGRDIFNLADG